MGFPVRSGLALLLVAGCAALVACVSPSGEAGSALPLSTVGPEAQVVSGSSLPRAASAVPVVVGGLAYRSMPWQVKVAELPAGMDALALQAQLQALLDDANDVLSTYQPDTELMRFNRAPVDEWMEVSPLLLEAVQTAVAVSAFSAGVYDVTVGPLVDLWGFGPRPVHEVPDDAAIVAARQRVGWRHIGIDPENSRLVRRADIQLDLSSLGEGLAVDALAAFLERKGVASYLIGVAGTLRAKGIKPDGAPWTVAVERPDGSGRAQRLLRLDGQVVSTSGAYRNYRSRGGRQYSHTLDPRTGWPVTHHGLSVTVILPAGAAARADALATAFNVLGPEAGLALATKEGLAVLYLEADGASGKDGATGVAPDSGAFRERATPAFAVYRMP